MARTGWRDPRLWIGLLLLAVSVLAGARILASADETVPVWALSATQGAGSGVESDDVQVMRVRFTDDADLARYFSADEDLPADLVLARSVGEGELLPRSAVAAETETTLLQVPLEVEPNRVPPDVTGGSVVDVYVDDRGRRTGDAKLLSAVTVVDAPAFEETFAVSGFRQVVVAVDADEVDDLQTQLASLDDPVLQIVRHPEGSS